MNKLYLFTILILFFSFSNAQPINPNDSANTSPGNINMVFYNLATRAQTIPSDTDWHIAVSVRATNFPYHPLGGTTIRINEAIGVNAYVAPNIDTSGFTTLDTTGWRNWWHLHDADTSIDEGALNSNRNHSDLFNYGWGEYNETTHNVVGDSVFLIQLPSGEIKKMIVIALVWDTTFYIKYSNLDNSNLQFIHISKGVNDNNDKEFMYLDLYDSTVHDKEPASNAWDLQFLKYAAVDTLGVPDGTMPVSGIWVNEGDSVAKATGVDVTSNAYAGLRFSGNLNTIGWNWKSLVDTTGMVQDSLAYFIKTIPGDIYKLVLTGYNDSTGVFSFYQTLVAAAPTGISTVEASAQVSLYPNPANDMVNIICPASVSSKYEIMDITGNILIRGNVTNEPLQINTSRLAAGIYIVNIIDNENVSTRKLVIGH